LDRLSIVAALAGDKNLGIQEIGGARPVGRAAMVVGDRANPGQRFALVAVATELSNGIVGTIVNATPAPLPLADQGQGLPVATTQVVLDVSKEESHDPTCGAMQWFHPLASVDHAAIGVAEQHAFTGSALGTKWSDPNKRSAFFGTFSY